jgi:hypothetical protein
VLSKVRLKVQSEAGADLQTMEFDLGSANANVKVEEEGRLVKVRATMAAMNSAIASTPPTTHGLKYTFVVEATQNGQPMEPSPQKSSGAMKALWRMPDGFGRYARGGAGEDKGLDDWASKEAYEWLDAHRGLITRINDVSGEHARDLKHTEHTRGTDIDEFHYYLFRGADPNSGTDNYTRLKVNAVAAFAHDAAASARIQNWILATRGGLDGLLATGKVGLLISTEGERMSAAGFHKGWAADLMKTGKLTVGGVTYDTGMGPWALATDARLKYNQIHNNHVHIRLSVK